MQAVSFGAGLCLVGHNCALTPDHRRTLSHRRYDCRTCYDACTYRRFVCNENLLKTKEFTVAIADAKNVVAADYVGVVSANDVPDKLAKTGWHTTKSEFVNAPSIEELSLVLECKLVSYDTESEICIGEVVNVSVDEDILDANGKIDLEKFQPICYDCDTHGYYKLGERVGRAFFDGLKLK